MTGRARGRSRGRARVREDEETPRPGSGPQQAPQAQDVAFDNSLQSRAMYRGNTRQARQPGLVGATGYTPLTEKMEALNVGTGGGSDDNHYTVSKGYHVQEHAHQGDGTPGGTYSRDYTESHLNFGNRVGGISNRGNIGQFYRGRGSPAVGVNNNTNGGLPNNDGRVANSCRANGCSVVPVTANYFKLERTSDWILYQYFVEFKPEVHSKYMKKALLHNHSQLLGVVRAYDEEHVLYLPKRLQNEVTKVYSTRNTDGAQIQITIKLTNELPSASKLSIHIFNLILKRLFKSVDYVRIGKNFYNAREGHELSDHRLKVLPGYLTSFLQLQSGQVYLNIDTSHKVIQTETALDFMYNLQERVERENHINQQTQKDFFGLCEKKVVGSIVMTVYNNKTYRVDGIDWDKRPTSSFTLRDGSQITYMEYYKKHYDIEIQDDMQPLFVSRPKRRDNRRERREQQQGEPGLQAVETEILYFLPELCRLIGFSESFKEDERAKRAVVNYTRYDPTKRLQTLTEFIAHIKRNEGMKTELGGWGLGITEKPVDIEAKGLPHQKIVFSHRTITCEGDTKYWYKDAVRNVLLNAVNLQNWLVIHNQKSNQNGVITQFIQCLIQVAPVMGIKVQQPTTVVLESNRNDAYIHAIRENLHDTTQLVMTIVPNFASDRYDAIKKFTCIEHPVPSQVVVLNTIRDMKKMRNVASNVALQINCKLGGEAWTVNHPLENLMVVGMDVYHDTLTRGKSVVGFVATMNKSFTRFFCDTLFQMSGQELVDGLQKSFIASLQHYHEIHGRLPEKVVVYRDGVGDGQLEAVVQYEVEQIEAAFRRVNENYKPSLCVVIVQKRINTRFFEKSGRNYRNPPPGTVVDTTVTRPDRVDFYLVSQSVRQGTVSPTHYIVVHDSLRLEPTNLQKLTYKLCHVYFNWPGTIRVPAPCQYAHKLAFLTGQSLHKAPARDLADRLFFL